ncbi:TPA: fimbrial protein [Escherichia coli]|nr:fimbrial protein [Escherichia coli]
MIVDKIMRLSVFILYIASFQVSAIDIPIKITGIVQIPPCKINNGNEIIVYFKSISITDLSNGKNWREVSVPVSCTYSQGTAYVKIKGTALGSNDNVLATNINNFGIALYQGTGTTTKLILGDGEYNGQNSIGYPIKSGLTGKENGLFTFTAVPFKEGSDELSAGEFSASANMSISYF